MPVRLVNGLENLGYGGCGNFAGREQVITASLGLTQKAARCFSDARRKASCSHSIKAMLRSASEYSFECKVRPLLAQV